MHGIPPSAVRGEGVSAPLHRNIEENFTVIPPKREEVSSNETLQR